MAVMMGVGLLAPVSVGAEGAIQESTDKSCSSTLLGFRPWYHGLQTRDKKNNCVIGTPTEDTLPAFIWTIVLNVLADLFSALAIVTIGFVIYGGFLYIASSGEPGKVAKGKKTLISAVIGLAIALLANLIINTIMSAINGGLQ